jgi:cbb3-type cytochrome oxidase maturation protein
MSSLVFLVPLALLLGGAALLAFLWSLRGGQYEDLDGAAERILLDHEDDGIAAHDREAGALPCQSEPHNSNAKGRR